MVRSTKYPEGVRFPRGAGRRRVPMYGGKALPFYEGAAGDYWLHSCYFTIQRLQAISYLCVNGPTPTPVLARTLGINIETLFGAFTNMKDHHLVESHPWPGFRNALRPRKPRVHTLEWGATEEGRKYLWRFGWVTGRLWFDRKWGVEGIDGRAGVKPWEILLEWGEPTLLRPFGLTLARHLLWDGPTNIRNAANLLGFPRRTVTDYVARWRDMGWLDEVAPVFDARVERWGRRERRACRWAVNKVGERAMERHGNALRWVAQTSGWVPPGDDVFLLDSEGPGWLTVEYFTG